MLQIKKLLDCQQNQAPRSREPCLLPEPIRMIKGMDPGPADSSFAWEHWAKTPCLERKGGDPLPMRRQSQMEYFSLEQHLRAEQGSHPSGPAPALEQTPSQLQ